MLDVKSSGSKSWVVRLQANGRRRDFGLGSAKDIELAEARDRAREYRRELRNGGDPRLDRLRQRDTAPSFADVAQQCHRESRPAWRNAKHAAQWLASLETYAFPSLGKLPVSEVETGHVRDVLAPIWLSKPETARRLRQRIRSVLDYAQGHNWRDRDFPMAALNRSLPRQPVGCQPFAAMNIETVPHFISTLRSKVGISRLALEALILTAARSGEIRGACWDEVNVDSGIWVIPAERMKGGKQHTVPLSPAATRCFTAARQYRRNDNGLVFPGLSRGKPLSDNSLRKLMRDLGHGETVHGFRSSFRDWVAERTSYPGEVAESALAHSIPNAVEAAYRRTDYLEKRRSMMNDWAAFCDGFSDRLAGRGDVANSLEPVS